MITGLQMLMEMDVGVGTLRPSGNIALQNPVVITTTSLANATQDLAYSQALQATGGTGSYTWVVTQGSLPAGLTLTSGGVIQGTPTTAGAETFTVQVTSGGVLNTQQLTLTVNASTPAVGLLWDENWSGWTVGTRPFEVEPSNYYDNRGSLTSGSDVTIVSIGDGPTGSNRAVYIQYSNTLGNPSSQEKCGFGVNLITQGSGWAELWLEIYMKFDATWPDIFTYTPVTYGYDHKTMFLWEGQFARRIEMKFGPNGSDMIGDYGGIHYQIGFIPPIGGFDYAKQQANAQNRCDANQLVWDNQWHQVRWHLKQSDTDGVMEAWIDGVKFLDDAQGDTAASRLGDTQSVGLFRFWEISANLNTPSPAIGFQVERIRVWDTDPGW